MQKKLLLCFLLFIFSAPAFADTIKLPQPKAFGTMSLEESIYRRRSERSFLEAPLTNQEISQLLWSCQGITDPQWGFRAAPSAGAVYPLEIYAVTKQGVYHYNPAEHNLVQRVKGDKRPSLARAALANSFIEEAPINIIVTAAFIRTRLKFGSRADRYVLMEAGHAAENLLLQATALNLKSIPVGAFWDDVVASALNLPPDNDPLYIIPIGYEKK